MIRFATCNKDSAIKYILSKYPSNNLDDPKFESFFDLLSKDVFRITDPAMHGEIAVVAGDNYKSNDENNDEYLSIALKFLNDLAEDPMPINATIGGK